METEKSNVSKAEEFKLLANEVFNARKYSQAIDLYTQAIELNSQNAVYFSNRAFAHLRLEEYGSAIQDATKAIEIDPKYSKGYYRRGAAHLGLGKFKEALKDFQQVKKMCPNDPDATKKLKECEKAVMKLKFEEAIAAPESERRSIAESIDFRTIGKGRNSSVSTEVAIAAVTVAVMAAAVMLFRTSKTTIVVAIVVGLLLLLGAYWWSGHNTDVEPQYSGARIEGDVVTLDFVKKMIEDFKNQKFLHKRYAFQIVLQTREALQALPSLVDIHVPDGKHFTVCGDVHGQYYDLLNIFELNGLPSEENPYLFNGDFVDRGSFSLEVILTLFAFKCMSPSAIYLARGNHESKSMNKIYGFEGEVRSKLNETFVELFAEVFCCLPLAHVINEKVFVVHGGLFSVDGVKVSDIRSINRFCEPPEEGLMCELLWSDPQPLPGRGPSKRGVGLSFGADVTKRFLQENNLDLVVRSHEVKDEGYEIEHDGKLITVFSAPNYCDQVTHIPFATFFSIMAFAYLIVLEDLRGAKGGWGNGIHGSQPNLMLWKEMGNKGAFIRFEAPDLKPNIVTFSAVPHPDVKPMAYANNFLRMFS
ncbi:Serine/threonine-protein phosphatase 5 [Glycine soja]